MDKNADMVKIALDIKNAYTQDFIEMIFKNNELGMVEAAEMAAEKGIHEYGRGVVGAFASDLLFRSAKSGHPLDLSYDTINEITVNALDTYRHNITENKMSETHARKLFCRMIAAYLMVLCANEHNCKLNIRQLNEEPSWNEEEKYWASCLEIKIGNKSKVDFLGAAVEGLRCNAVKNMLTKQIWYSVSPIIEAYKKATGVNLAEMGFCDVVIA